MVSTNHTPRTSNAGKFLDEFALISFRLKISKRVPMACIGVTKTLPNIRIVKVGRTQPHQITAIASKLHGNVNATLLG